MNWAKVKDSLEVDRSIKEVTWCVGGEHAARDNLNKFLSNRLRLYEKEMTQRSMVFQIFHRGYILAILLPSAAFLKQKNTAAQTTKL